jgi:hypothetical protein
MNPANAIRSAMTEVAHLRDLAAATPEQALALTAVKAIQASRFASTYSEFLATPLHGPATRFFLEDLYGVEDYSARDRQFSRIAGSLQSFFPEAVIGTAVALAELHLQTERLDYAMAKAWLAQSEQTNRATKYVSCWRLIDAITDRYLQLDAVICIGHDLDRLTRIPGLRMTLRMMRGPAKAAGLSALQKFLENGFDAFIHMAKKPDGVPIFLNTIQGKESQWIEILTTGPA